MTTDVAGAVNEYKAGKVEFKTQKDVGVVHCVVGKISFSPDQLTDNVEAFLAMIRQLRPTAAKGTYIRSITVSATPVARSTDRRRLMIAWPHPRTTLPSAYKPVDYGRQR